jgi:hypothetical protein
MSEESSVTTTQSPVANAPIIAIPAPVSEEAEEIEISASDEPLPRRSFWKRVKGGILRVFRGKSRHQEQRMGINDSEGDEEVPRCLGVLTAIFGGRERARRQ